MFRLPNDLPWISPCLLWQTSPRMQKALGGSAPVEDEGTGPLFVGPSLMDGEILLRRSKGKILRKTLVGCHICICWFYMTLYDVYNRDMFIHHEMYIIIYIIYTYVLNIQYYFRCWNLNGMESSIVLWFFMYRTAYKYMYIANTWNVNSPTVGFGWGEAVICGVFWDTFCLSCLFKEHFNTANQSKLISLGWSYVIINLYAELW